ncbi:hypothetical protein BH10BAC5_BH10BAC5_18500 [soil metagenome]
MKISKILLFLVMFSITIFSKTNVFAQDDDCCDDGGTMGTEMTMEDWQRQMDEYNAKKTDLMNQLNSLNSDIDALKRTLAGKDDEIAKAENDLYALVGTTKSGVADFRKKFEETEKKINNCKGPQDAADARKMYFNEIDASRIKCLPEFWDRYLAMKKKLEACEKGGVVGPCEKQYTVVKGDCLYKISSKKDIYGDSRFWPKIYEANKNGVISGKPSTIKNPNLIYPGQVLRIPCLTDQDKMMMKNKVKNVRKKRTRKMGDKDPVQKKVDYNKVKKDTKKDEKQDMKKTTPPDTKKDVKKDEKKTTPPPTTPKK